MQSDESTIDKTNPHAREAEHWETEAIHRGDLVNLANARAVEATTRAERAEMEAALLRVEYASRHEMLVRINESVRRQLAGDLGHEAFLEDVVLVVGRDPMAPVDTEALKRAYAHITERAHEQGRIDERMSDMGKYGRLASAGLRILARAVGADPHGSPRSIVDAVASALRQAAPKGVTPEPGCFPCPDDEPEASATHGEPEQAYRADRGPGTYHHGYVAGMFGANQAGHAETTAYVTRRLKEGWTIDESGGGVVPPRGEPSIEVRKAAAHCDGETLERRRIVAHLRQAYPNAAREIARGLHENTPPAPLAEVKPSVFPRPPHGERPDPG